MAEKQTRADFSGVYEEDDAEDNRAFILKTAPFDARFSQTNQTKHCWQAYVDYFKCINTKGEDFKPCKQFSRVYHSMCPVDWVERWDDQRDRGVFPSALNPDRGYLGRTKERPLRCISCISLHAIKLARAACPIVRLFLVLARRLSELPLKLKSANRIIAALTMATDDAAVLLLQRQQQLPALPRPPKPSVTSSPQPLSFVPASFMPAESSAQALRLPRVASPQPQTGLKPEDDFDPLLSVPGESSADVPRRVRKWGSSCLACRRRKKACKGRDANGRTLCEYCPSVGLECVFSSPGQVIVADEAKRKIDKLRIFIEQLSKLSEDERAQQLAYYAVDWEVAIGLHDQPPTDRSPPKRRRTEPTPVATPESPFDAAIVNELHESRKHGLRAVLDASGFGLARTALVAAPDSVSIGPFPHQMPSPPGDKAAPILQYVDHWLLAAIPAGASFDGAITFEESSQLLSVFHCWYNSRWCIISPSLFSASMHAGDGVFCSPFLLASIFALCARDLPSTRHRKAEFGARAYFLLSRELISGSKLTTIQGILCLAGFATAESQHSTAFNLCGLVARMVEDLTTNRDQSTMRPEEKELRDRCAHFMFISDKMISITMGRPPMISREGLPPVPDVDAHLDAVPWEYVPTVMSQGVEKAYSAPRPSYSSTCFKAMSETSAFVDDILRFLGARDSKSRDEIRSFVVDKQAAMASWQRSLPSTVSIDIHALPASPPPPHVIYLSLYIRVAWLLLCKPFIEHQDIPEIRSTCFRLADEVSVLFRLYCSIFPPSLANHLHVFAVLAASHLDLVRLSDPATTAADARSIHERLAFAVNLLTEAAGSKWPGVREMVDKLRTKRDAALGVYRTEPLPAPLAPLFAPHLSAEPAGLTAQTTPAGSPREAAFDGAATLPWSVADFTGGTQTVWPHGGLYADDDLARVVAAMTSATGGSFDDNPFGVGGMGSTHGFYR